MGEGFFTRYLFILFGRVRVVNMLRSYWGSELGGVNCGAWELDFMGIYVFRIYVL